MAKDTVDQRVAVHDGVEPLWKRGKLLHKLPWHGRLGSGVLLGAVLAILLVACGGGLGANTATGAKASKDLAPDFSFTLYQGEIRLGAEILDLSDLQGRHTVLNFWAGLCPPCRAELPDLQLFYEDFDDQVNVVGVDLGTFTGLGNQDDAQKLLRELEIAYPNGFTTDDTVVRRYQVLSMPTTVFINSKGEIFKKWNGALNRDILTEQTTELLNQESGAATRAKLGQE